MCGCGCGCVGVGVSVGVGVGVEGCVGLWVCVGVMLIFAYMGNSLVPTYLLPCIYLDPIPLRPHLQPNPPGVSSQTQPEGVPNSI